MTIEYTIDNIFVTFKCIYFSIVHALHIHGCHVKPRQQSEESIESTWFVCHA